MKNSVLIVLAVIFLVILGLKWGHDARVKRRVAEADCYSQMANAIKDLRMSNKNTLLYLCSELWGETHWRTARETDILARKEYICQRHMSSKDKLIASKNPEKLEFLDVLFLEGVGHAVDAAFQHPDGWQELSVILQKYFEWLLEQPDSSK